MNDVSKKQPPYRTLKKRLKARERTIQVRLIQEIDLTQILVFLLLFFSLFLCKEIFLISCTIIKYRNEQIAERNTHNHRKMRL